MSLKLSADQIETLERIVRDTTMRALTDEAKLFVRRWLLAGASPDEIVAMVQNNGGSMILQNGVLWYAQEMEGQLMFTPAEGQI